MTNLVFTYGTLMKGQPAYGRYGDVEYVADGVLKDYGIYEVGEYPAAVPVQGFAVYGEIYKVSDEVLKKMDDYEDEGSLYIRRLLEIEVKAEKIDAWVYEYNQDVKKLELRAPIGKWTGKRKPITDYAWYVCYGSNLLMDRFADYVKRTDSSVYAEKPYILNGELYFAKESKTWDHKAIAFLDLSVKEKKTYGFAYLLDKDKIDLISKEEGTLYPKMELGFDEYGIAAYTVSSPLRFADKKAGIDYLTIIAAGLQRRYGLNQNQLRRYLNCNERFDLSEDNIEKIIERHIGKNS